MGFSNLIADALSMGLGDFLSSKAELDFEKSESDREKWEFSNAQDNEVAEHAEMLVAKGVAKDDADIVSTTLAKYPEVFHEVHLPLELGLHAPDGSETPAMDGLVTL